MTRTEKYFKQFLAAASSSYIPKMKAKKGNVQYPSDEEKCKDCGSVRSPSRVYPFSLYNHCKSQKHLRNKLNELGVYSFEDLPLLISHEGILGSLAKKFLSTYTGTGPT